MIEKTHILNWAGQNFLSESTISQLIREEPQCRKAIQMQNALSAYVYLITWFLSDFVKERAAKEQLVSKKRGKKADRTED